MSSSSLMAKEEEEHSSKGEEENNTSSNNTGSAGSNPMQRGEQCAATAARKSCLKSEKSQSKRIGSRLS